jgi:hypothetical protein
MAFDDDDFPPAPPPVDIAQRLRHSARIALAGALLIATLILIVKYGKFFAAPILSPPLADVLPLPEIRTPELTVTAPPRHENILTAPTPAPTAVNPAPQKIDWKTTPITGAVPNAYLVVYLEQRAVGLVVDGEYIRVYQPATLPLTERGVAMPIGDYFVVAHELQNNLMKLRLNYPSPADAEKFLAANKITAAEHQTIVEAAARKKLPERLNPIFGAPVYILGSSSTAADIGNVIITVEQMIELWTAIADGAPVMIRP